jgi:hypothetical protein
LRNALDGLLQARHIIREGRNLRHVFIHGVNRQPVARPEHLLNELCRRLSLGWLAKLCAQADVKHQRQVEGLLGFLLENSDRLRVVFVKKPERFHRQVWRGTVVFVEDAHQHVY